MSFVEKTVAHLQQYGGEAWKPYLAQIDQEYRLSFARHIKVRIQTLTQFRDFCLYFSKRKLS